MKTNLHKAYLTNRDAVENGVWRPVAPGIEMLLASSESRRYRAALREAFGAMATTEAAITEAMATGLLLDWRGVADEDGAVVPFSVDAARALLADPDMYLLADRIALEAANLAHYRAQQIEDAAKN